MDRREDLLGKDGRGAYVLPGKSGASPLIAIVTGADKDIALPDRHRLSEGAVRVLRAWIDEGADWPERLDHK